MRRCYAAAASHRRLRRHCTAPYTADCTPASPGGASPALCWLRPIAIATQQSSSKRYRASEWLAAASSTCRLCRAAAARQPHRAEDRASTRRPINGLPATAFRRRPSVFSAAVRGSCRAKTLLWACTLCATADSERFWRSAVDLRCSTAGTAGAATPGWRQPCNRAAEAGCSTATNRQVTAAIIRAQLHCKLQRTCGCATCGPQGMLANILCYADGHRRCAACSATSATLTGRCIKQTLHGCRSSQRSASGVPVSAHSRRFRTATTSGTGLCATAAGSGWPAAEPRGQLRRAETGRIRPAADRRASGLRSAPAAGRASLRRAPTFAGHGRLWTGRNGATVTYPPRYWCTCASLASDPCTGSGRLHDDARHPARIPGACMQQR